MTLRVHPDEIVRTSHSRLLATHPTWERVRLSDVADVLNGFAFKSADFSKSEGTPLLRIRDVGKAETEARYVGEFDDVYLVGPGSMVVGMDGDFRVARWAGPEALLNQRVCRISLRDASLYDESFLFYALPGYLDAINAQTSSVTVKHLSSRTIQDIPLPLPPLAEQRRIVAAIEQHVSCLAAAVQTLRRARLQLERLRRAALIAVFRDEWPSHELSSLTDPERPIRYGILMPKEQVEDGVLYVRVRDYPKGTIELESLRRTSHEIAHKYRRASLRTGDVLLAIRGTYGRVAIVPPELEGGNITQDTARIAPIDTVDRHYLATYLRSEPAQRFLRRVARGVAVKGVNIGDLRTMPVPVPPLDEQRRIVAEVERQLSLVDALATAIEAALRRSGALRRSILEQAFTGELVPQDPDDEPASLVLERIVAHATKAGPDAAARPRRRATISAEL